MNEGTYIFTAILEDGWPPSRNSALYTQAGDSGRAGIVVDPNGCIHVIVESPGNEVAGRFHFISQPVSFPTNAPIEFRIAWKTPAAPEIRINDVRIKSLWTTSEVCTLSGLPVLHSGRPEALYAGMDTSLVTAATDRFFLETVAELDQRTHSLNEYNVLKASALLRLILTDGLLATVNRSYRKKITFSVARHPAPPILDGLAYVEIDPTVGFLPPVDQINLERFLKTDLLWYQGRAATVLDLIRLTANAMGGVHLGKTESEHHESLRLVSEQYVLPGQARNAVLSCLWSIARITLVAMRELVATISEGRASPNHG